MSRSALATFLGAGLALLLMAGTALAAADEDKVRKDLAAVIALQGKPCGGVTRFERLAENDYLVQCRDGNSYRIRVGANGRVLIEPR
jgi:hypothetical protein